MNRHYAYAVIAVLAYLFVLAEIQKLDDAVTARIEHQRQATNQ